MKIFLKTKRFLKKIDDRSLQQFFKKSKKDTKVKITNPLNNKSILARVGVNLNIHLFIMLWFQK